MKKQAVKHQFKIKLKKGDIVKAITGEDADGKKTGKILAVNRKTGRVIVEGFNYVKKHIRKNKDYPQGGIVDKEAPLAVSNVKLVKAAGEREEKDKAK